MKLTAKRLLAVLLTLCMVLPCMSLSSVFAADAPAEGHSYDPAGDPQFTPVGKLPVTNEELAIDGDYSDWDDATKIDLTSANTVLADGTEPISGTKTLAFNYYADHETSAEMSPTGYLYVYGEFEDSTYTDTPYSNDELDAPDYNYGGTGDEIYFRFDVDHAIRNDYPDVESYTFAFVPSVDANGDFTIDVCHWGEYANYLSTVCGERTANGWKFEAQIQLTEIFYIVSDESIQETYPEFSFQAPYFFYSKGDISVLAGYRDFDGDTLLGHYVTTAEQDQSGLKVSEAGIELETALHAHNESLSSVTTEPTCAVTGVRTYKCSYCKKVIRTEAIAATGNHTPDNEAWQVITEADCGNAGQEETTCTVCGQAVYKDIPATGKHTPSDTWEYIPSIDPKLIESSEVKKCTVCGSILNTRPVAATYTPLPSLSVSYANIDIDGDFEDSYTMREIADANVINYNGGSTLDYDVKLGVTRDAANFYFAGYFDDDDFVCSTDFGEGMDCWNGDNVIIGVDLNRLISSNNIEAGLYQITPVMEDGELALRINRTGVNVGEITDLCTYSVEKVNENGWKFELAIPASEIVADFNTALINANLARYTIGTSASAVSSFNLLLTIVDRTALGATDGIYSTTLKRLAQPGGDANGFRVKEAALMYTVNPCTHVPDGNRVTVSEATCLLPGTTAETCTLCGAYCNAQPVARLPHTPADDYVDDDTTNWLTKIYGGRRVIKCTVCGAALATETINPSFEQVGDIYSYRKTPTIDGAFSEWDGATTITDNNVYDHDHYTMPHYMADAQLQFLNDDNNLYMYGSFGDDTFTYTTSEYYKDLPAGSRPQLNSEAWDGDVASFGFSLNDAYWNLKINRVDVQPAFIRYCFTPALDENDNFYIRVYRNCIYDRNAKNSATDTNYTYSNVYCVTEEITDIIDVSGVRTDEGWAFEVALPLDMLIDDFNKALRTVPWYNTGTNIRDNYLLNSKADLVNISSIINYYDKDGVGDAWANYCTIADNTRNFTQGNGLSMADCGMFIKFCKVNHAAINNWTVTKQATYAEDGLEENLCPTCGYVADSRVLPRLPLPMTDVSGKWYENAVRNVYTLQLMSGVSDTEFGGDVPMTRAMFVTTLGKYSNINVASYQTSSFSDVRLGQWYTPYVEWAYRNGITSGLGDSIFGVDVKITREQMAVFMMVYTNFIDKRTDNVRADLSGFADKDSISGWALESVSWAVGSGLISGMTATTISPKTSATRAQVAQILYKFTQIVPTLSKKPTL